MEISENMIRVSVGTLNSVMADTVVIDRRYNDLIMTSLLGYNNIINLSSKELNESSVCHVYCSSLGTYRSLHSGYETYTKNNNDSDNVHCLLYAKDAINQTETGEEFTSFIFCNSTIEDDAETHLNELYDKVYDKLIKYSSIPILKEWTSYIITKLNERLDLRELSVYTSNPNMRLSAYLLRGTKISIRKIIQEGLRNNSININGNNLPSEMIDESIGLNQYLSLFGETLAEKIQKGFRPKFIPGEDTYDTYVDNSDDFMYLSGKSMYEGQKSTIQAAVNNLKVNNSTFVLAEMGAGKTLLGAYITYSHHANRVKGLNSIIMCPSHLCGKWKREIEEHIPNAKGYIINNLTDIIDLEPKLRNRNRSENMYVIVSKEKAKLGYDTRPCAIWSKTKKAFVCPTCGQKLYKVEYEGKGRARRAVHVPLTELDMTKKYSYNVKCPNTVSKWDDKKKKNIPTVCNSGLWTSLNKDENHGWIKLGSEGWILEKHIIKITEDLMKLEKLGKKDSAFFSKIFEQYSLLQDDEPLKVTYKGPKKFGISKYIKNRMKNIFDYCLLDEVQDFEKQSQQAFASYELMKSSKKTILLTGTLLNGYADSLFYLLFRTNPKLMIKDGFKYKDEAEFARIYGTITKETSFDLQRGQKKKKSGSIKEKRMPGVSPLVFTKFLLPNAVFLSLSDISSGLPSYTETPVQVNLDEDVVAPYRLIEKEFKTIASSGYDNSKKSLFPLMQTLTVYPDAPHCTKPVVDPDSGDIIIEPTRLNKLRRNKDIRTLALVKEKLNNNEKVLIYYNSVNTTDIGNSLCEMFTEEGISAFELKSTVSADKREAYIEKEVSKGAQVMVCNPSLVETGLDLLDFTTIIFYQVGYNLFTMRQASRRSWRLSQTRDINVYFLYYKNTIQEQVLSLMAGKLQASMAIEGKFDEEGLRAMSNNDDMLTQIANNVVNDIKNTVSQDLFKSSTYVKEVSTVKKVRKKTSRRLLEDKMDSNGIRKMLTYANKKSNSHNKNLKEELLNNPMKIFF